MMDGLRVIGFLLARKQEEGKSVEESSALETSGCFVCKEASDAESVGESGGANARRRHCGNAATACCEDQAGYDSITSGSRARR
jgi:hypothetical protein